MDPSEQNSLLQRLHDTRDAIVAITSGVSEEQSRFKEAPDRWSILECMEHVALVEHSMYVRIAEEYRVAGSVGSLAREMAILQGRGADRSRRFSAPEHTRPTGRFGGLQETIKEFAGARERTIRYIAACDDDLRRRSIDHPLLGPINCQEALMLLITHPLRHADQMREIKDHPHYPGVRAQGVPPSA